MTKQQLERKLMLSVQVQTKMASGVYFYRFQIYPVESGAGNFINIKSIVALKKTYTL
jgi:hypothetical protein